MKELLEYLARALVEEPDAVAVEQFEEDDGTVVLELSVADDDYELPDYVVRAGGGLAVPYNGSMAWIQLGLISAARVWKKNSLP